MNITNEQKKKIFEHNFETLCNVFIKEQCISSFEKQELLKKYTDFLCFGIFEMEKDRIKK